MMTMLVILNQSRAVAKSGFLYSNKLDTNPKIVDKNTITPKNDLGNKQRISTKVETIIDIFSLKSS